MNRLFHPLSIISSPNEPASSSESAGENSFKFFRRIFAVIVLCNNNQTSLISFSVMAQALSAWSDGRIFCNGMFVGILLKTNLPYQAPPALHNIQICDAWSVLNELLFPQIFLRNSQFFSSKRLEVWLRTDLWARYGFSQITSRNTSQLALSWQKKETQPVSNLRCNVNKFGWKQRMPSPRF